MSSYFDSAGRLQSAQTNQSHYGYIYDAQDRVTNENLDHLQVVLNTEYGRRDDLRTKLTVGIGYSPTTDTVTEFAYDNQQRLTSLEQSGGGVSDAAEKKVTFDYDVAGQFTSVKRYADLAAELFVVDSQYEYDSQGRLSFLNHRRDENLLAAYSYSYDSAGRIDLLTSFDGTTDYDYLDDGQLSSVDYDFADTARIPGDDEDAITYDDNGNNVTGDREAGEHNRPDTDGVYEYEYDNEGNRTRRTAGDGSYDAYTWDHRNRLTGVTHYDDADNALSSVLYVYDAFNRLIKRTYDADGAGSNSATVENYVYDGDQIILRLDGSEEVQNRYLWGPAVDQLLADEEASDEIVRWALGDHQNSIRDLVEFDDNGTSTTADDSSLVVDHMTYSAFGVLAYSSDTNIHTTFAFTGRLFDDAFKIQYNTHRWYDAELQQWLSVDPILFGAGDPNPRRYVSNDPVNKVDPDGLEELEVKGGVALWIIHTGWGARAASLPLGSVRNGRVEFDPHWGGGSAALKDVKTQARNFRSRYGDASAVSEVNRRRMIEGAIDNVREGKVIPGIIQRARIEPEDAKKIRKRRRAHCERLFLRRSHENGQGNRSV